VIEFSELAKALARETLEGALDPAELMPRLSTLRESNDLIGAGLVLTAWEWRESAGSLIRFLTTHRLTPEIRETLMWVKGALDATHLGAATRDAVGDKAAKEWIKAQAGRTVLDDIVDAIEQVD